MSLCAFLFPAARQVFALPVSKYKCGLDDLGAINDAIMSLANDFLTSVHHVIVHSAPKSKTEHESVQGKSRLPRIFQANQVDKVGTNLLKKSLRSRSLN